MDDRLAPGWVLNSDLGNRPSTNEFWKRAFAKLESRSTDVGNEQSFRSFMLSMLALDPDKRLSTKDLLVHPYLADVAFCADGVSIDEDVN